VKELTSNHLQVLSALSGFEKATPNQVFRRIDFTQHEPRVVRILFDLREKGLAHWSEYGYWSVSPEGESLLFMKAVS